MTDPADPAAGPVKVEVEEKNEDGGPMQPPRSSHLQELRKKLLSKGRNKERRQEFETPKRSESKGTKPIANLDPKEELSATLGRAMPDYGDIIDGDDDMQEDKPETKDTKEEPPSYTVGKPVMAQRSDKKWRRATITEVREDGLFQVKFDDDEGKAELRQDQLSQDMPDRIYIKGVERLTRNHIAEILGAMQLPSFKGIVWISDDECVVVFASPRKAAKALNGMKGDFRDLEDYTAPGPGIWRAQRGYLTTRLGRFSDQPEPGFKKKHRCGRQVRAFREWAAMEDERMDADEEFDAPGGEWSHWYDAQQQGMDIDMDFDQFEEEDDNQDDDGPDLLAQMAMQDKTLLGTSKSEREKEESTSGVKLELDEDGNAPMDVYGDASYQRRNLGWLDFVKSVKSAVGFAPGKGKGKGKKGGGNSFNPLLSRKRNRNDLGDHDDRDMLDKPDNEERKKRQRRAERFSVSVARQDVGGGSVSVNAEEEERRKKRAERFASK